MNRENIGRLKPPKDCRDLELWLSGVINDAIRDAVEAGCPTRDALRIARILGRGENRPSSDAPDKYELDFVYQRLLRSKHAVLVTDDSVVRKVGRGMILVAKLAEVDRAKVNTLLREICDEKS